MKKNVIYLAVFVLIFSPLKSLGQEIIFNHDKDSKDMEISIVNRYTGDVVSSGNYSRPPSNTNRETSNSSYSFEGVQAAAAESYQQNEAQVDAYNNKAQRYGSRIRDLSNKGNIRINTNRLLPLGFDNRTPEQIQAFEYFAKIELHSGGTITLSGKNALYKADNGASKVAAARNANTKLALQVAINNEMPGDVSGMSVDNNALNRLQNVFSSDKVAQFKQLSPAEKQKEYNNVYNEWEYRNNQIVSIKNKSNELEYNYRQVMSYYAKNPKNPNYPDKTEIMQKYNQESSELKANMNNEANRRSEIENKLAQLAKECPGCVMQN